MDNYLTIIKRYLEGDISSSERIMLREWLDINEDHKILFKKEVERWYKEKNDVPVDTDIAHKRFEKKVQQKETPTTIVKHLNSVMKYAAIIVLVCIGGYYYTMLEKPNTKILPKVVSSEVAPSNKIKISQADGTVVYMDYDDKTDVRTTGGGLLGTKEKGKFVVKHQKEAKKTEMIDIAIPKGKLFELVLSDGTKVWLNAASKLRFPQHFLTSEKQRVVYLEGEAFFDVVTNKNQPFIVKTTTIDVQVVGTKFNVSSYQEDAMVKTTLVEGAVLVNDKTNTNNMLSLTPNDQAIFVKNKNDLRKEKVDTSLYTLWMDKKIILQNESFATVIPRLERAYDVTIVSHNDKLNKTRFTGEFDIEKIDEILQIFSETLNFTYDINQKKIEIHQ